jgi:methylenetetrahydrofolate--tRNA-(uracil-5-)-methyltransferase
MKDGIINVIGAGLAGCEAAWQIARQGINVRLFEMKPHKKTPAHHSDTYAELVCSNSFRSDRLENAVGLLKEELRLMDSLIISCADKTRVPAGGALAVDRHGFSQMVTEAIHNHPLIEVINEEVTSLSHDDITIIATGPLTSDALAGTIAEILGLDSLYFFDAAAPIVRSESINYDIVFRASRYGKGDADYINCPMSREEYQAFYEALIHAETAELNDFEDDRVFEGCMPIESMAKRGPDTIRFGPLKPVGLIDPRTGREPWAVVQLRQDNAAGSLYNMVGFQTRLKWGEQKRVFSMIPGLENAEFERFGVMHMNTFINSPRLLDAAYRLRTRNNIFFAGQITGVEGYVESTSSGLVAGINAARQLMGRDDLNFPASTAIGALARYISNPANTSFQPMNVNFGIMEPLEKRIRDKKEKYRKMAERAIGMIEEISRLQQGQ